MMSNNTSLIFEMYATRAETQIREAVNSTEPVGCSVDAESIVRVINSFDGSPRFTFQDISAMVPIAPISRSHLGDFEL